jgi:5-oxoprolinase (ATP-hydrolysing) subunit A
MATAIKIDLNCDLGESFGRYKLGQDATMMAMITSANIACGLHAGDPDVMAYTVSLAKAHGVAIGAHPGYPDLQGFGRRRMDLTSQEIIHALLYQLGALHAFVRTMGSHLTHVKPHGALYNLASEDADIAKAVAEAVVTYDPALILVGLAGSVLIRAGREVGLKTANEGFPDRAYLADGNLSPRSQPGALITDPDAVAENALKLVHEGITVNGKWERIDTLCLHGDNPQAVDNARVLREKLALAGIVIVPLREVL